MGNLVAFTGGGTGGHVFPGIAVIEALRDYNITEVCWIGSPRGVERAIVESWGIPFYAVPAGKLRRYFSLHTFVDAFRVPAGFLCALYRLKKISPAFVFSKGGYVAVPVVAAARMLGIPCYTHDSDLDPGLATKLNSRFVDVVVTGNPVRKAVSAGEASRGCKFLGIKSQRRPVLLFLGGSLGAAEINTLVSQASPRLTDRCFVVHQTGNQGGSGDEPRKTTGELGEQGDTSYYAASFFSSEYPDILAAAQLVICRAGAGTVWELAVSGTPAVLIPLGLEGSRGDQLRNAELYAASGAARILPSGDTTVDILVDEIFSLLDDPKKQADMSTAARSFAGRDSADIIAQMISCEIHGTTVCSTGDEPLVENTPDHSATDHSATDHSATDAPTGEW
ncbi:MAG: UDP-N-acetylglucosamine--N-acetylmuramyl-(pentapeptide) pyrophosphoryl-undecaprenol N-acetylglucosamine transferase [Spirochaeta sp.]|nr:UDP-N-acetylglucosamine--N-acetylmuramyl-(pentapeptide) pyrophosphoryl-undecaprenol N-acetylglucosamine transferase [Spirochaeta sp.]